MREDFWKKERHGRSRLKARLFICGEVNLLVCNSRDSIGSVFALIGGLFRTNYISTRVSNPFLYITSLFVILYYNLYGSQSILMEKNALNW